MVSCPCRLVGSIAPSACVRLFLAMTSDDHNSGAVELAPGVRIRVLDMAEGSRSRNGTHLKRLMITDETPGLSCASIRTVDYVCRATKPKISFLGRSLHGRLPTNAWRGSCAVTSWSSCNSFWLLEPSQTGVGFGVCKRSWVRDK